MRTSPSLIFSLMSPAAVGLPMALGADPHSSATASRVAFLIPVLLGGVAIVLAIRELNEGRSAREWARVTIRLMFPIAVIIGITLLRW